MFLDDASNYLTVWKLAHNWVGADAEATDPDTLPEELRNRIQRLMSGAMSRSIPIRNRRFAIFIDDSFFSIIFDFRHYRKFIKCLRNDEFDKTYLDSLYIKRSDVLRWCQDEYLSPPPIWQPAESQSASITSIDTNEEEDETGWYDVLTQKRKQRVACLEMARKLWKINPEWSYEEVYRHPVMKQYGTPEVFSLKSFKSWAREFAPDAAKAGGRPKESNPYEQLTKR